ncbi:hypothetical protein [Elizabethkingia ursingii]
MDIIKQQAQELATKDQFKQIRFKGEITNLPLTILQSLPEIVKREVDYPLFKNSGEEMIKTLNMVSSMVGVNFGTDEEYKKTSGAHWISFCQGYQLTAHEIIEAYRMALRQEFPEIKVFPNLSLITAGEILKAYQEFKHGSEEWNRGRKLIHKTLNPVIEESEETKLARRKKMWDDLVQKVKNDEPCVYAGHFYSELDEKGCFNYLTASDKNRLIRSKAAQILNKEITKGTNIHFRKEEAVRLLKTLNETNKIKSDYLNGMAIQHAKDHLVYEHIKKHLKDYL